MWTVAAVVVWIVAIVVPALLGWTVVAVTLGIVVPILELSAYWMTHGETSEDDEPSWWGWSPP